MLLAKRLAVACVVWCAVTAAAEAQQQQRKQPVRWLVAAPVHGACRFINGVRVCPQQARQRPAVQLWQPPLSRSVPQYYQQAPPIYFRGGW